MDADVLRSQLRKSLGSSKRFQGVALRHDDESSEDDDDKHGDETSSVESSAEDEDEDEEEGEEEEEEDDDEDDDDENEDDDDEDDEVSDTSDSQKSSRGPTASSPSSLSSASASGKMMGMTSKSNSSDSLGAQIKSLGNAKRTSASHGARRDHEMLRETDDDDENSDGSSDEEHMGATTTSEKHALRSLANGAGEGSEDSTAAEGNNMSHASVLDAWSRQIEETMGHRATPKPRRRNRMTSDDFEDDLDDDEDESAFNVQYSKAHALPASASERPPTAEGQEGADEFIPGAQSREDLENLGKTFIRVKAETGVWLDRVLGTSMFETGSNIDATDTGTLYQVLKSGVVLCRIANAILPGCITSFTSDFSKETPYMQPLSERENIKKFIRACHDAMSIPDSLLFDVGDLHNMQNIPKVILSLRAVAEYARKFLHSAPEVHWRKLDDVPLMHDEDAVLMASSEMSKMDSATVHHMYAVDSAAKDSPVKSNRSPEEQNFEDRKRNIQKNLVLSTLTLQQQAQSQYMQRPHSARSGGSYSPASSSTSRPTPVSASNLADEHDQRAGVETASLGDANNLHVGEQSVESWLASLGLSIYFAAFVEDGWDELSTVALMHASDLRDVGVRKKGHVRKLERAIKQLKGGLSATSGRESPMSGSMRSSRAGFRSPPASPERTSRIPKSPRGGFATQLNLGAMRGHSLHSMDRQELYNKDKTWAECRTRANVTQDLDDAKAIWKDLHDIRADMERHERSLARPEEAKRSMRHLLTLTEDLVRSLMPFDAPIVIDIGWDSIKCGYVFSKTPVLLPSIVGKFEHAQNSMVRTTQSSTMSVGRDVFDECGKSLQAGGSRSSSYTGDQGSFVVRHAIHRGIDSIVDPQVVEWDDMEKILQHMYRDILQTKAEHHPVLIIEPCRRWGSAERNRLMEILTNIFKVPAVYFTPAAPLVAYKASQKSCVVLDMGESRSTASVVFNNRLVKNAVVHSPIGGLQLTELMMQSLTQDGYDFKSVFEAQNPARFSSTRHFMEQEMAREIKDRVCVISNGYEEYCVTAENLPEILGAYLPRVTRGAPYLNVSEARVQVPEALFSPDLVRRDQFYNGGSLQHIIKAALDLCTESIVAAASETVLICGGTGNLRGLAGRLQKELNEMFAHESRKPPQVILATEDDLTDSVENPIFTAWQGGCMLALQHDFQMRWIAREAFLEQGDEVFTKSSIAEGTGPFPLYSPDTALYKANRAVHSMRELLSVLGKGSASSSQPQEGSSLYDGHHQPRGEDLRGRQQNYQDQQQQPKIDMHQVQSHQSQGRSMAHRAKSPMSSSRIKSPRSVRSPHTGLTVDSRVNTKYDDESYSNYLSPRSLKSMIQDVAVYLEQHKCSEGLVLDVKMHLFEQYSRVPPRRRLSVEDILLSLPKELRDRLAKFVSMSNLEVEQQGRQSPMSSRNGIISNLLHANSGGESDDFDDDDDDGEEYFAMAI